MKSKSNLSAIITGVLWSVALTVVFLIFCSILIVQELIPSQSIEFLPAALMGISVLAGVIISLASIKKNKLIIAGSISGIYFLLTLIIKFAFIPGDYNLGIRNLLVIFCAAAIGVLLRNTKKNRQVVCRKTRVGK